MSEKALQENILQWLEAVDLCLAHRFITPTLILIYSGIDTLAWLNRRHDEPNVTGEDFMRWVDTYMLPDKRVQCKSSDLWSARCGLVHTFSPESSRTRSGKAKMLYYAWGQQSVEPLMDGIHLVSREDEIAAIHVDLLIEALRDAVVKFLSAPYDDPDWQSVVFKRAGEFFLSVSTDGLT